MDFLRYCCFFYYLLLSCVFVSCVQHNNPEIPQEIPTNSFYDQNLDSVFDINSIPEIRFEVNESEWNELLAKYDNDKNVKDYISCDLTLRKENKSINLQEVGLRLHGNTSRRRPEGIKGEKHTPESQWHHCHYMINLDKFKKDNSTYLEGISKIIFKWFHNDPSYVREIYCYDLFKRFNIWTIGYSSYCRVYINVKSERPIYLGVYGMFEVVDDDFIKRRSSLFGGESGFLWKCANVGLNDTSDNLFFVDDNSTIEHPYELKEGKKHFNEAKQQLRSFIKTFHEKGGEDFVTWIESVCDVELLLRTYAVNVGVGNWDDYWNHATNYYIYFNSRDVNNYKFFFVPYDYDEVLGRTASDTYQKDAVIANPLNWGDPQNDLIFKIISFPKYRKIYIDALKELSDPEKDYLSRDKSIRRIVQWQSRLYDFVSNDTGEDMTIEDLPGAWSSENKYRLLELGPENFFDLKCKVISTLSE